MACVENNIAVWKQTADMDVVGNAIKSYIEDNFDIPSSDGIRYNGGAYYNNPPSNWETL